MRRVRKRSWKEKKDYFIGSSRFGMEKAMWSLQFIAGYSFGCNNKTWAPR